MSIKSDAKTKIESFHSILKNGFSVSTISEKNYNYEFTASGNGDSLKVQVYFGKKGVKVILQGNTDTRLYNEIYNIIFDEPLLEFSNPEPDEPNEYIGTDESGKGDYFGPLVVGAVYLNKSTRAKLVQLGVRDSKELSDTQIFHMAKKILNVIDGNYKIIAINPPEYNMLYEKEKNLNTLLSKLHSKVIAELHKVTECNNVIVDRFSKTDLLISSDPSFGNLKIIQIPKAEKYTAVAAASILARNAFNEWFEKKEHEGLSLQKGASSLVENIASEILESHGSEVLSELVKLHFKTTKKISNF
jgi:ribonuclease HIII